MLSEVVYSQLDGTIFINTFINEQNRFIRSPNPDIEEKKNYIVATN